MTQLATSRESAVAADRPCPVAGGRAATRRGWIFVGPFLVVFALTFLAPIGYAIVPQPLP